MEYFQTILLSFLFEEWVQLLVKYTDR